VRHFDKRNENFDRTQHQKQHEEYLAGTDLGDRQDWAAGISQMLALQRPRIGRPTGQHLQMIAGRPGEIIG
jgi:hypothetical protein